MLKRKTPGEVKGQEEFLLPCLTTDCKPKNVKASPGDRTAQISCLYCTVKADEGEHSLSYPMEAEFRRCNLNTG